MEKFRIFFELKCDEKKAIRIFQKAQDSLMDVFFEENMMPLGGLILEKISEDGNGAKKK